MRAQAVNGGVSCPGMAPQDRWQTVPLALGCRHKILQGSMVMAVKTWGALALSACLVFVLLASGPAPAQGTGMTEDAMTRAFTNQKTRGLSLAPVTAPAATGTGTAAPTTTTTTEVTNFAVVPKEDQVNVNIRFDFDSAALRDDQKPQLATLCSAVKKAGVERLRIVGHTDAAGTDAYNARLSLLRAEEVRRHLNETCAIPLDAMEAVGMGKQFLFDPADPRGEINRRVEFQALS
jgi:outer membrane protein OmpA-like peptidoglycan-associated protein